jgi:hypothetical protein
MTRIELLPALVFAALAARSAVYWFRHRVQARDAVDDLLFAAFVTGRVGTWLTAACMFLLFATIDAEGRAFTDEARGYSWLFIVFLALGAMQLVAAWFLSARGRSDPDPGTPEAGDEPRPPR